MSKINRRKMFGFAAVLPMAAVGVTANNAPALAASEKSIDRSMAPDSPVITLQNNKRVESKSDYGMIALASYQPVGPQLGIAVGEDGHMWLKIKNEWKKVIVE